MLFDRLAVVNLDAAMAATDPATRADLEYLCEEQLIFQPDLETTIARMENETPGIRFPLTLSAALVVFAAATTPADPRRDPLGSLGVTGYFGYTLRFVAADLERNLGFRAVAVLPTMPTPRDWDIAGNLRTLVDQIMQRGRALTQNPSEFGPEDRRIIAGALRLIAEGIETSRGPNAMWEAQSRHTDAVEIALHAFPEPQDSASLEDIIAFARDPSTTLHRQNLRRWLRNMANAGKSPVEIAEELQYLIAAYEDHIRLARLKTRPGILESLVVLPADVAEALVKCKWGDAARRLFALRHRRVAMLEQERSAPGAEIAYIVKARESFGED